MKVLLVDDDRDLLALLQFALKRAGFGSILAYDAETGLRAYESASPDIAILDVNLGATDGFTLLERIRQSGDLPVIMLTARDNEGDKIRGLELGADDYVTKPFSPRELVARIRAQLRRVGITQEKTVPVFEVGALVLNVGEHSATNEGRALNLTVTEFRFLQALMEHAGDVVATSELLRTVWGYDEPGGADLVRAIVHRLRRKLGDDAANPRFLHTIPGVGMMLKPTA